MNLVRLRRSAVAERWVFDTETLANRLGRMSPESAQGAFVEYVRELRARRVIGGKVYAADVHEVVVLYGRRHERLGRVGARYGLKLVILVNVQGDRELVVGFAFATLPMSERAMLLEVVERLHGEVAPFEEWL